jgi:GrpB-like predicted nucleotidyltransferase (UPF0157 family)
MPVEYAFAVRAAAHDEARGLFFVYGSLRWGAAVAPGHRVSLAGDFEAPIAAVESTIRSLAQRDCEVGLGFSYADEAELGRWRRLLLTGSEMLITRPSPAPVIVVAHDPEWPVTFAGLRDAYARVLGDLAVAIHHVGSTSVPGLAAKPVIDIDIEIASRALLPEVTRALATLGYHHNGDYGVPEREAFDRGAGDVPRDGSGRAWLAHNLYVCASGNVELRRHLLFRDWMRAHAADAAEYGALKQRLAERYRDDRDSYIEGKTELVERVLRAAASARGA